MLVELARREKEANIKPDPDIDLFMKAVATEGQKENLVTEYIIKLAIVGAIAMTDFIRTKFPKNLDNGALYTGALFFAVTMLMFVDMAEISMTISKLPVYFKKRELRFFAAWAYALLAWFLKIPLTIVEVAL